MSAEWLQYAVSVVVLLIAFFLKRLITDVDELKKYVHQISIDSAVVANRLHEIEARLNSHSERLRQLEIE